MSSWHQEMEEAVAARKKAINGVNRWLVKRAAAEKRIDELSARQQSTAPLPGPDALAEEAAPILSSDLRPVFGA